LSSYRLSDCLCFHFVENKPAVAEKPTSENKPATDVAAAKAGAGKAKPTVGDRTQEMIRQNKALKDERRLQVSVVLSILHKM
jgi:hypothetical protein